MLKRIGSMTVSGLVVVLTMRSVTPPGEQASVALGESNVHCEPHSAVLLVGQVRTGGVVSRTVTVCEQLKRLLQESEASHMRVAVKPPQTPAVRFVVVFRITMF